MGENKRNFLGRVYSIIPQKNQIIINTQDYGKITMPLSTCTYKKFKVLPSDDQGGYLE